MKSKQGPSKKAKLDIPADSPKSGASTTKSASTSASASSSEVSPAASSFYPTLATLDMGIYQQITNLTSQKATEIQIPATEEFDGLQTELENMWSNISIRIRTIQKEQGNIQNASSGVSHKEKEKEPKEDINDVASLLDFGHGTRTSVSQLSKIMAQAQQPSSSSSPSTSTSVKRGASSLSRMEKQPKKKVKFEPGIKRGGEKPPKPEKEFKDYSASNPQEAPNEFWNYADNFCREITKDDIASLEKKINDEKFLPDNLFTIPPLGKAPRESASTSSPITNSSNAPLKDICGPLTQKLVTALVEDRISNYGGSNSSNGTTKEDSNEGFFLSRPGLVNAIGLDPEASPLPDSNTQPMEARLKQVLSAQSLFKGGGEDEEISPANSNDEVLSEIKRTQHMLKRLHQHNYSRLQELCANGKREIERANIRRELEKCDKEIHEGYKNTINARIKKKPLTKKERDQIFKALDSRNTLIKSLSK